MESDDIKKIFETVEYYGHDTHGVNLLLFPVLMTVRAEQLGMRFNYESYYKALSQCYFDHVCFAETAEEYYRIMLKEHVEHISNVHKHGIDSLIKEISHCKGYKEAAYEFCKFIGLETAEHGQ